MNTEMLKQRIKKIDNAILIFEKYIIIASVLAMLFLSFSQVVLRIFFNSGISSLDIFLRYLVMISALFGSSMASYYVQHFRIEIFQRLSKKEQINKFLNIFSVIVSIIAVAIIFIYSLKFIPIEFNLKEVFKNIRSLNFSPEYMIFFLPLIFFDMFCHTFFSLFNGEGDK